MKFLVLILDLYGLESDIFSWKKWKETYFISNFIKMIEKLFVIKSFY